VHDLAGGELHKTACVCRPDLVRGGVFRDPKIAFAVGGALLARLIRFIVLKKAVLRSDEVVIRLGQQIRVGNEKRASVEEWLMGKVGSELGAGEEIIRSPG
jgi:hypothetical protein